MEYLTTHDLVWINSSITGKVNPYDYVTLEAAMAGQYSYGDSDNVPEQAARLLERLLAKAPFSEGNMRTAFIAALSFLNANGYATKVDDADAASEIRQVALGQKSATAAIAALAAPAEQPLPSIYTLRKLISHECNLHKNGLRFLAEND
jgi:death-on-curing protein